LLLAAAVDGLLLVVLEALFKVMLELLRAHLIL
jgi:hypothetical protein